MAQTPAQKRAYERYSKHSMKSVCLKFCAPEHYIYNWLCEQPNKNGYIKSLIKADMKARGRLEEVGENTAE